VDVLWKRLCDWLEQGEDVVLATIVDHDGSTPRTAGSRMIVRRDGRIAGTIGGGRLEAEVMADAPGLIAAGAGRLRSFDLGAGDVAEAVDMICGGRVTVLMEFIPSDRAHRRLFATIRDRSVHGPRVLLVASPEGEKDAVGGIRRCLVGEDGEVQGDALLTENQALEVWHRAGGSRVPLPLSIDDRTVFASPIHATGTVLLFGAGHVSREVSRLCTAVGFRTVVVDDRPEFANPSRFETAGEIRVVEDFAHAFTGLNADVDAYVVILTRGHRHDKTVLAQALRTQAVYIGMIGSRRKRDDVYAALLQEGFSGEDLQRVHCPIGIEIHAETPEEIAFSIVGELIAVRAKAHRSG
jgi:xanthine dehydrogenase accessory factor